jgi:hypothetical protein
MIEKQDTSGSENEFAEPSTECQPNDGYEVGYGKPPKSTRFKRGVSGNPSGRPPKKHCQSHNVGDIFREVFATRVKANVGGKSRYIKGTEAAFLQLRAKLSAGDLRAVRLFLYLCRHFDVTKDPHEVNPQLKGLFDALMAGPVDTP